MLFLVEKPTFHTLNSAKYLEVFSNNGINVVLRILNLDNFLYLYKVVLSMVRIILCGYNQIFNRRVTTQVKYDSFLLTMPLPDKVVYWGKIITL